MRTLAAIVLVLLAGCASRPKPVQPRGDLPASLQGTEVDPVRLHNQLIIFADDCAAVTAGTMSNIAADSQSRVVWEQTLNFKIRIIPLYYLAAGGDDPRYAMLDVWVMMARLRQFLTTGEGAHRFGKEQQQAIEMAGHLETRFLALAKRFYPEATVEDLKDEIDAIANRNPLSETAEAVPVHAAEAAAPSERGALGTVLAIPLAPVSGIEGIKQTATSIDSATRAFEAFTHVTQLMPEQVRWQAEILLLEADSLDTVVKVRQDLNRLSTSVDSISKTAATLPQDVRQEVSLALKDVGPTLERIEATLVSAHQVAQETNATAEGITRAAEAWNGTAVAVNQLLETYEKISGPPTPPDANTADQPSDLEQFSAAADHTRAAAAELRAVLGDLDKLNTALAQATGAADASINHATERMDGLVDRMTWRAMMVVGAFAGAMLIYRVLAAMLIGRRAAER